MLTDIRAGKVRAEEGEESQVALVGVPMVPLGQALRKVAPARPVLGVARGFREPMVAPTVRAGVQRVGRIRVHLVARQPVRHLIRMHSQTKDQRPVRAGRVRLVGKARRARVQMVRRVAEVRVNQAVVRRRVRVMAIQMRAASRARHPVVMIGNPRGLQPMSRAWGLQNRREATAKARAVGESCLNRWYSKTFL